eukprot:5436897-Amphidinium_carterae.1
MLGRWARVGAMKGPKRAFKLCFMVIPEQRMATWGSGVKIQQADGEFRASAIKSLQVRSHRQEAADVMRSHVPRF